MPALDTLLVILVVLGASVYLGRHYYKKWKSPKACGTGSCSCSQSESKMLSKEKSL
ncbi:MAG: hypothetical protein CMI18_03845 [Opitutaceae bacterium]|nr:hypothetical protein [Opitutaceae bacterium]